MIKNQEYLSEKASYCLDLAKKLGATDSSVIVSNSISESVNFRNKKLDESNRSDNLAIGITTNIYGKRYYLVVEGDKTHARRRLEFDEKHDLISSKFLKFVE